MYRAGGTRGCTSKLPGQKAFTFLSFEVESEVEPRVVFVVIDENLKSQPVHDLCPEKLGFWGYPQTLRSIGANIFL